MNYCAWINKLTERVDQWKQNVSSAFHLEEYQIERPMLLPPRGSRIKKTSASIPPSIQRFHGTAAASCNIRFLVKIPDLFYILGNESHKYHRMSRFVCGFSILSESQIKDNLKIIKEVVAAVGKREPFSQPKGLRSFINGAMPFSINPFGEYLVLLEGSARHENGVYFLSLASLREEQFAERYADSFDDWLAFLEENCYIGPDLDYIKPWIVGNKAVSNPLFTNRLLGLL